MRARKSSGTSTVPGPRWPCSPPAEPRRQHPVAAGVAQRPHVGVVVDEVRRHPTVGAVAHEHDEVVALVELDLDGTPVGTLDREPANGRAGERVRLRATSR